MTDPIDLLDEASWLDGDAPTAVEKDRPVALAVDFNRTVGDLRRLLALARGAEEELRGALESTERVLLRKAGCRYPCKVCAALEGTDR